MRYISSTKVGLFLFFCVFVFITEPGVYQANVSVYKTLINHLIACSNIPCVSLNTSFILQISPPDYCTKYSGATVHQLIYMKIVIKR